MKTADDMNNELTEPYLKKKVFVVVKDMKPTKAPGIDIFWPFSFNVAGILSERIVLNGKKSMENLNVTNIVLKTQNLLNFRTQNPLNMTNFQPISLCKVIYKVVGKIVANHLQTFSGKLISNNILLAYEILNTFILLAHEILNTFSQKRGGMIECISTVSYSISINGLREDKFQPTMGPRQKDPLSPFLFLICNEGLSTLMRLARREGRLKGVRASRTTTRGEIALKNILKEYENCLGQCVNFDKSTIFFSTNTLENVRLQLSNDMGVRYSKNLEKYLGLPNIVNKKRKKPLFKA
ncbi:reverse transcriptase [Gossypium australe]|uniref:Reverse transcriptase n=1 Tax=Gossypium australe TaxID=47621 RepID=A0A5B6VIT2_9ROSI|nr:reverse transcriptase [Gossypium australe]